MPVTLVVRLLAMVLIVVQEACKDIPGVHENLYKRPGQVLRYSFQPKEMKHHLFIIIGHCGPFTLSCLFIAIWEAI